MGFIISLTYPLLAGRSLGEGWPLCHSFCYNLFMDNLKNILNRSLAKRGLKKTLEGPLVCFYCAEWPGQPFTPVSYANGVLKVSVASSPAAAELQMVESELKEFLNKKTAKQTVRQIRIVVSNRSD
ncbi:MAG: DciA family protein [Patescibacteria group bacterium]|jgi:predicted nucleic acid-binding Zn ribbon protein